VEAAERSPISSADGKIILAGCEVERFGGIMGEAWITYEREKTSGLADMSGGGSNAPLEIGTTLELARKRRGLSLKQVEEATKIRAVYLADLEWEHFDVLPAVYMQGYLKTYASFLHLDADAMVAELKSRRSLSEEPPYPLYVGPSEDDSLDDILTALEGGAANSRDATGDEEEAGPTPLPAGFDARLYLGSAVFLLLCAAVVVLALTVVGDERPSAVSQVREPLTSRAPETSPAGAKEHASVQSPQQDDEQKGTDEADKQRSTADEKDKSHSDRSASAAEDRAADPMPQNSASAQASASPAATASAASDREDRMLATTEPSRRNTASIEAPTRQDDTASPSSPPPSSPPPSSPPPSSPPPTRVPGGAPSGGNSSPPPRNDGVVNVNVNVGGKDPVQLSGGPFDD
jgi:Helix-turn-helix domain